MVVETEDKAWPPPVMMMNADAGGDPPTGPQGADNPAVVAPHAVRGQPSQAACVVMVPHAAANLFP